MVETERLICASEDLLEKGAGIGFLLSDAGNTQQSGFVIRYDGAVHGYVNRCAHVPITLDWQEGDFFDLSRHFLICSAHGAQYQPETGRCVLGPCKGKFLQKLNVVERDGRIYLIETTSVESHL
jgi:nitrite reductase/ring-hydroxylating ferredoxin subunit